MNRREFTAGAALLAASQWLRAGRSHAQINRQSLLGHRFITHISVISVGGVEATRSQFFRGDVSAQNTPARVRARRDAFQAGAPDGRMTWAISWLALNDQRDQFKEIRRLLAHYHAEYGDEVTFFPGGYFEPMYNTRLQSRRDLHDGLQLVSTMVGNGYRPQSVIAGFMSADSMDYLAREEGIHVCQGQIWSQHDIDAGDGDGGISYAYYPSREHYLKPAQGSVDFIDCVCLDGWSCDLLSARHNGLGPGYNSRMGLGPIETINNLGQERGRKEMLDVTAIYFDTGFALNQFGWTTAIWEVSLPESLNEGLTWWLQRARERWPGTRCVTEGEFGLAWREQYRDNSHLNYRFVERGTRAPGSETNLEIRWFMNREFRLALLRDWEQKSPEMVIDFTRYDLPAKEPAGLQRDWSLINVLNQKGTRPQDKPVRISQLPAEDRQIILKRYPDLAGQS